jgi:hypothetical protein
MNHYESRIWSDCRRAHLVIDSTNQKSWWCLSSDYYATASIEEFENIKLSLSTGDQIAHGSPWQEISFNAATAMIASFGMFDPVTLDDDEDDYNWIT